MYIMYVYIYIYIYILHVCVCMYIYIYIYIYIYVCSKEHPVVERRDFDLRVRKPVLLKPDAHRQPYLSAEVYYIICRYVRLCYSVV